MAKKLQTKLFTTHSFCERVTAPEASVASNPEKLLDRGRAPGSFGKKFDRGIGSVVLLVEPPAFPVLPVLVVSIALEVTVVNGGCGGSDGVDRAGIAVPVLACVVVTAVAEAALVTRGITWSTAASLSPTWSTCLVGSGGSDPLAS